MGFDPKSFLAEPDTTPTAPAFDPQSFLAEEEPKPVEPAYQPKPGDIPINLPKPPEGVYGEDVARFEQQKAQTPDLLKQKQDFTKPILAGMLNTAGFAAEQITKVPKWFKGFEDKGRDDQLKRLDEWEKKGANPEFIAAQRERINKEKGNLQAIGDKAVKPVVKAVEPLTQAVKNKTLEWSETISPIADEAAALREELKDIGPGKDKFIDDMVDSYKKGTLDTKLNWFGSQALLRGDKKSAELSKQLAEEYRQAQLEDWQKQQQDPNFVGPVKPVTPGKFREITRSVARMAPGLVTSMAVSAVPIVGAPAAFAGWASQGAGQVYQDAVAGGADPEKARISAAVAGPIYAAIEQIQIGQISKNPVIKSKILHFLKEYGIDVAKEVNEEGLQGVVTTIATEKAKGNEDVNDIARKAWQSYLDNAKNSITSLAVVTGATRGAHLAVSAMGTKAPTAPIPGGQNAEENGRIAQEISGQEGTQGQAPGSVYLRDDGRTDEMATGQEILKGISEDEQGAILRKVQAEQQTKTGIREAVANISDDEAKEIIKKAQGGSPVDLTVIPQDILDRVKETAAPFVGKLQEATKPTSIYQDQQPTDTETKAGEAIAQRHGLTFEGAQPGNRETTGVILNFKDDITGKTISPPSTTAEAEVVKAMEVARQDKPEEFGKKMAEKAGVEFVKKTEELTKPLSGVGTYESTMRATYKTPLGNSFTVPFSSNVEEIKIRAAEMDKQLGAKNEKSQKTEALLTQPADQSEKLATPIAAKPTKDSDRLLKMYITTGKTETGPAKDVHENLLKVLDQVQPIDVAEAVGITEEQAKTAIEDIRSLKKSDVSEKVRSTLASPIYYGEDLNDTVKSIKKERGPTEEDILGPAKKEPVIDEGTEADKIKGRVLAKEVGGLTFNGIMPGVKNVKKTFTFTIKKEGYETTFQMPINSTPEQISKRAEEKIQETLSAKKKADVPREQTVLPAQPKVAPVASPEQQATAQTHRDLEPKRPIPKNFTLINETNDTAVYGMRDDKGRLVAQIYKGDELEPRSYGQFKDNDALYEAAGLNKKQAEQQPDRRVDLARRKKISEMTDQEKTEALTWDPLTGFKTLRAWHDVDKKKVQAVADSDSLKWINDNLGHEAGNKFLKIIGRVFREAGIDGYRGGEKSDEIHFQADDAISIEKAMERAYNIISKASIRAKKPDGTIVIWKGLGFSYGYSTAESTDPKAIDAAIKQADLNLNEDKVKREREHLRAGRGERPYGLSEIPSQGNRDTGRRVEESPSFSKAVKKSPQQIRTPGSMTLDALKEKIQGELPRVLGMLPKDFKGKVNVNISPEFMYKGRKFGGDDWEAAVWYDPNGKVVEVHINPNISEKRLAMALMHELPGHIGSRLVYADNLPIYNQMKSYFDKRNAENHPSVTKIKKLYASELRNDVNNEKLFDEWTAAQLADYIEKGKRTSVTTRVYNFFRELLTKLGVLPRDLNSTMREMIKLMRKGTYETLGGNKPFQRFLYDTSGQRVEDTLTQEEKEENIRRARATASDYGKKPRTLTKKARKELKEAGYYVPETGQDPFVFDFTNVEDQPAFSKLPKTVAEENAIRQEELDRMRGYSVYDRRGTIKRVTENDLPAIYEEARTFNPDKSRKNIARNYEVKDRAIGLAKYALRTLSGRLLEMSPIVRDKMQKHINKIHIDTANYMRRAIPLLEAVKKLPEADYRIFDIASKNSDIEKMSEIADKHGFTNELEEYRGLMNDMIARAKTAGYETGYLENYFPRIPRDRNQYYKFIRKTPEWGQIQEALQQKAKDVGRDLLPEEQDEYLNQYLRGYAGKNLLGKPGNLKERKMQFIDNEMNSLLEDSILAIPMYIERMAKKIGRKELFGNINTNDDMIVDNLDESIGEFVGNLIRDYKLNPEKQDELIGLLKSYFNFKPTDRTMAAIKNISYATSMGSGFSSMFSQMQDMAFGFLTAPQHEAGAVLKALMGKTDITVKDLGIQDLGAEFRDSGKLFAAVDKLLSVVGLKWGDVTFKNAFIQANLQKFRQMARTGKYSSQFRNELTNIFEGQADQLIEDLKNKRDTDLVKLLVMNEMSKYQPITQLQVPQGYLDSPRLRIAYALKTYQINQVNAIIDEGIRAMQNAKSGDEWKNAFLRVISIMAVLMAAGVGMDELKDLLFRRNANFGDYLLDNLLKLFMISRYTAWQARTNGWKSTLLTLVAPPLNWLDYIGRDIRRVQKEDFKLKNLETLRMLPVIGQEYYWWLGGGAEQTRKRLEKNLPPVKYEREMRKLKAKAVLAAKKGDTYGQYKAEQKMAELNTEYQPKVEKYFKEESQKPYPGKFKTLYELQNSKVDKIQYKGNQMWNELTPGQKELYAKYVKENEKK